MAYTHHGYTHQVRDCEGNHLSFPIPPIELLEHMLQHPEKQPIRKLLAPCLACLQQVHEELRPNPNPNPNPSPNPNQVHEELRALCCKQLQHPSIARFPQLEAATRTLTIPQS